MEDRLFQKAPLADHEPIQRWGETMSSPGIWIDRTIRVRRSLNPPKFMESPLSLSACIGTMNHPSFVGDDARRL